MDAVSFRTTLTAADWQAYLQALTERVTRSERSREIGWMIVLCALLAGSIAYAAERLGASTGVAWGLLAGALLVVVTLLLRQRAWQRDWQPEPDGIVLGPVELEFSAEGIRHTRAEAGSWVRWSSVRGVSSTPEHVFVWIDRIAGHIVPVRDIPAEVGPAALLERIRTWSGLAPADTGALLPPPWPQPATSPADGPRATGTAGIVATLTALARLYGWRAPFAPGVRPNEFATVLLGAGSIALWVAVDAWRQNGAIEFYPWLALTGVATYVLLAVAIAWCVARLSRPPLPVSVTLWTAAAVAPLAMLAAVVDDAPLGEPAGTLAFCAALLLALALVVRALRAYAGTVPHRALLVGAACLVAWFASTAHLYVGTSMWLPADLAEESDDELDVERVLFEQPARIDAALARLDAGGSGPRAWFVGFAGYGEQRVFAEEVAFAARAIDARYGSGARTLQLVNDRRDLERQPLASVTGLRQALRGIAARMDLERDVLFLVLSSHGSEEPTLSVSNGLLPLAQLDGATLAAALRDSGIRWKVVIVSACHSGAFIAHLAGPDTVVITAAAAERTSFGCSDDRDLTYFGEAFFRDALPGAADLEAAFRTAATRVAARERREDVSPSEPQASFSPELAARLRLMDRGPSAATTTAAVAR